MKRLLLQLALASLLVVSWAAAIADPPVSSGPFVIRSNGEWGVIHTDWEDGYNVVFGLDPREFCANPEDFPLDNMSFTTIELLNKANRRIEREYGKVRAFVWPFTGPDDYECEVWLTVPPLASGMAKWNLVSQGAMTEEEEFGTFGWNAHGLLYDRTGAQTSFTSIFRGVVANGEVIREELTTLLGKKARRR